MVRGGSANNDEGKGARMMRKGSANDEREGAQMMRERGRE